MKKWLKKSIIESVFNVIKDHICVNLHRNQDKFGGFVVNINNFL